MFGSISGVALLPCAAQHACTNGPDLHGNFWVCVSGLHMPPCSAWGGGLCKQHCAHGKQVLACAHTLKQTAGQGQDVMALTAALPVTVALSNQLTRVECSASEARGRGAGPSCRSGRGEGARMCTGHVRGATCRQAAQCLRPRTCPQRRPSALWQRWCSVRHLRVVKAQRAAK